MTLIPSCYNIQICVFNISQTVDLCPESSLLNFRLSYVLETRSLILVECRCIMFKDSVKSLATLPYMGMHPVNLCDFTGHLHDFAYLP